VAGSKVFIARSSNSRDAPKCDRTNIGGRSSLLPSPVLSFLSFANSPFHAGKGTASGLAIASYPWAIQNTTRSTFGASRSSRCFSPYSVSFLIAKLPSTCAVSSETTLSGRCRASVHHSIRERPLESPLVRKCRPMHGDLSDKAVPHSVAFLLVVALGTAPSALEHPRVNTFVRLQHNVRLTYVYLALFSTWRLSRRARRLPC
jgi:hypothetical protein